MGVSTTGRDDRGFFSGCEWSRDAVFPVDLRMTLAIHGIIKNRIYLAVIIRSTNRVVAQLETGRYHEGRP